MLQYRLPERFRQFKELLDFLPRIYAIVCSRSKPFLRDPKAEKSKEMQFFLSYLTGDPADLGQFEAELKKELLFLSGCGRSQFSQNKPMTLFEIGNFELRLPWIFFSSYGGRSLNVVSIDDLGTIYKCNLDLRKNLPAYCVLTVASAAVSLVSPVSVENSKELRFLLDEGQSFRYVKMQFFDKPHLVEFKSSIPKSCLQANSLVSSFSETRLYSPEMRKEQRCLLFFQRTGKEEA